MSLNSINSNSSLDTQLIDSDSSLLNINNKKNNEDKEIYKENDN